MFDDRQQAFDKHEKRFEKLLDSAKKYAFVLISIADALGVVMPELVKENKAPARLGVNLEAKSALAEMGAKLEESYISGTSPWPDDEARRFYTDLVDLKERVPASVLGAESSGEIDKEKEGHPVNEPVADAAESQEDDNTQGTLENALPQLSALLSHLPDMASQTSADETAVEFAFLASRPARTRLVRALSAVSEKRYDLVPYYSRLAATLSRYMPDVGAGLVSIVRGVLTARL